MDTHSIDPEKDLRQLLNEKGLRTTKSRIDILLALKERGKPSKVDEVRISASLPASQTVSVYRTLDLFCSLGLAQRLHLENGTQLFASAECCAHGEENLIGHHHHVLCRECGKMEPLHLPVQTFCQEAEGEARKMGFSNIRHAFEVYGICPDCTSHSK